MKVFVNPAQDWKICALRTTDRTDLTETILDDETAKMYCDAALLCFRVEIAYQKEEDGNIILDKNGNKIIDYSTFSPAMDFNIIQAIQYLNEQNNITALQLALTEQYETSLALQEELTSTQMALTEIYEGLGV